VFEDLSDLLRAQKKAPWREVAGAWRMKFKNPLTPIALSAERIQTPPRQGIAPMRLSRSVIALDAETIAAVETYALWGRILRCWLVFQLRHPQPASLNNLVESALTSSMGDWRHPRETDLRRLPQRNG